MGDWRDYISTEHDICGSEPCAAGTRVLVVNILDSLAEGATQDELLKSYPSLMPEHIRAALAYAAELAREERLLPLRRAQDSSSTRTCQSN
jgi:uncharacterized protein (DUF433 family)